MSIFLNTRGKPSLAIALCARCGFKFPIGDLWPDRDNPGLMVCRRDNDRADPWRAPFVPKDGNISVKRPRPDVPIPTTAGYTVNNAGEVVSAPFPVDTTVEPSST